MRKVAIVTMIVALAATLGLSVATAGAAAHRDNQEFCDALANVDSQIGQGSTFDSDSADALADSYREAAKHAPKKVKKAAKRIAKLYDSVTDEDSVASVFSNRRFIRDSLTLSKYFLRQCADLTGVSIPEN